MESKIHFSKDRTVMEEFQRVDLELDNLETNNVYSEFKVVMTRSVPIAHSVQKKINNDHSFYSICVY